MPFLGGGDSLLVLVLLDHAFGRHEVAFGVTKTDQRLWLVCATVDPAVYWSLIAEYLQFLVIWIYEVGAWDVLAGEMLGQVLVLGGRVLSLASDGRSQVVARLFIRITTSVSID